MSKDKEAMRYGARLCCIYDWAVFGEMDRTAERLGKSDCVEAMRALWAFVDPNREIKEPIAEDANKLWRQASREFPGVGAKDILAAEKWIIPELVRVYGMQAREIKAAIILHGKYLAEGCDLDGIAERNKVYKWEFFGWTDFNNRIPWLTVLAIENLEAAKIDWTIDDMFQERNRIRSEYADFAGIKKK